MAIITNEFASIQIGADSGRVRVIGNAELTGGDTTFVIQPGLSTNPLPTTDPIPTRGLRRIDCWGITYNNPDARTVMVQHSYSSANDADIVTVLGETNTSYDWWVEGEYVGQ